MKEGRRKERAMKSRGHTTYKHIVIEGVSIEQSNSLRGTEGGREIDEGEIERYMEGYRGS